MKAVFFFVVFLAFLSAFAFANKVKTTNNGFCIPTPFNLTHSAPQIVVPGVVNLYFGYQISVVESSVASSVTIQGASVVFTVACSRGGSATFTVPIADQTYTVPANAGKTDSWNPSDLYLSGFQSGPVTTTEVCGAGKGYAITGAVLSAGLVASQATKPVDIRFTYFTFVDLDQYIPSPLPTPAAGQANIISNHVHFDTNDIKVWFGDSAYCHPKKVWAKVCLSISVTPPMSILPSGMLTYSATTSPTLTASPSHRRTTAFLYKKRRYAQRG